MLNVLLNSIAFIVTCRQTSADKLGMVTDTVSSAAGAVIPRRVSQAESC